MIIPPCRCCECNKEQHRQRPGDKCGYNQTPMNPLCHLHDKAARIIQTALLLNFVLFKNNLLLNY
jgi:hypothetical protein